MNFPLADQIVAQIHAPKWDDCSDLNVKSRFGWKATNRRPARRIAIIRSCRAKTAAILRASVAFSPIPERPRVNAMPAAPCCPGRMGPPATSNCSRATAKGHVSEISCAIERANLIMPVECGLANVHGKIPVSKILEAISVKMEEVNAPEIGPIIQRHRKARNLTLEQLAGISGVSKSMLSQIERGQANPTFAVLWSLTRALRIEFADLLAGGAAPVDDRAVQVVTATNTPEIRNSDRSCRLRILSPPRLAGELEWYDVEIAPAGSLDSAPHAAGTFEHFTAFTPGFEVTSGHSTQTLKVGETARYPADVPHRIANTSKKPARGLMVVLYR